MPLTGAHFQTWSLYLAGGTLRDPATGERHLEDRSGWIQLISEGAARPPTAFLILQSLYASVPEPGRIGRWHLHTLEVHPDGTAEWVIDGRRHASIRTEQPLPDSVDVAIEGRTVGTDVEHGKLRVWLGIRYGPARAHPQSSASP